MAEPSTLLLGLLFLAVAAGWVLGRGASSRDAADEQTPPSQYYLGLNFLLDGEQESALKAFSEALAVNAETFETHITFGSLLRKRGEVDNAIKIHQSLLSRTRLPDVQKNQAHLELAKDFIAAGLLDRAEQLLKDLIELSVDHEADAKALLIDVCEASRDWSQARLLAESQLTQTVSQPEPAAKLKAGKIREKLSHYCCEDAEDHELKKDAQGSRALAQEALKWSEDAVWPQIILARLDQQEGQPARAYDRLVTAAELLPERFPEVVNELVTLSTVLDRHNGFTALVERLLKRREDPQIRVILADAYIAGGQEARALNVIKQGLESKPSSLLLARALDLMGDNTIDDSLVASAHTLASRQSAYLCGVCGFHGPSFYWQCPGCKSWDTLYRPVR